MKLMLIAKRFFTLIPFNRYATQGDLIVDLVVVHQNGCPLDFEKLRTAPENCFLHDIDGIATHLNRSTGILENCFLPRCSKPEEA